MGATAWLRRRQPGPRGTDLVLFSVVWAAVGLRVLKRDPDPSFHVPVEYLGINLRAAIWFVAAILAFISAHSGTGRDRLGWGALMVPPAIRAASYWVAWVQGMLTENIIGFTGLWPEAISWTVVTVIVYRLAGRPEITPDVEMRVRRYNLRKRGAQQ